MARGVGGAVVTEKVVGFLFTGYAFFEDGLYCIICCSHIRMEFRNKYILLLTCQCHTEKFEYLNRDIRHSSHSNRFWDSCLINVILYLDFRASPP